VFVRIGYDRAYLDELRRVVEYGILRTAAAAILVGPRNY
jgi:hypothetical protein